MREIKFRAWFIDIDDGGRMIHFDEMIRNAWNVTSLNASGFNIMQYTGLKDKNGNKIFEGDRIQDEEHFYYTVYWSSTQLSWMCCGEHLADFIRCGIEIIGNIHEANK